jgi:hypothetical protein
VRVTTTRCPAASDTSARCFETRQIHAGARDTRHAARKNNRTLAGYNTGDIARRSPAAIGECLSNARAALVSGDLPDTPPIRTSTHQQEQT